MKYKKEKSYKLYATVSKYYDQFNKHVDYGGEAEFVKSAINKHKKTSGNTLLDVACGTGTYDLLLKKYFTITALDSSKDMLTLAKRKVKGVLFKLGKMQSFNLNKKFDVVLCRGAMDYNFSYEEVGRTLKNFNRHLKPGGVLILTFEEAKEGFKPTDLSIRTAVDKNIKIIEACSSHFQSGNEYYEWNDFYFIMKGNEVKILREPHHKQGLFEVEKICGMMEKLDFKVVVYTNFTQKLWGKPYGRKPVFIGVKLS